MNSHRRDTASTVVFHAINGVGTGHISRQTALATRLIASQPQLWPVLLSEGPATLDIAGSLPVLQMPSTAHLRDFFDVDEDAAEALLRATVRMVTAAIGSLDPQLVVHDTLVWPPLMRAAQVVGARQALCLRPRRDLKEYLADTLCPVREMDLVFVPDDRSRNEEMASILDAAGVSALWTWPIVRPPRSTRGDVLDALRLDPSAKLIVVTSGGGSGSDSLTHFQRCLEALAVAQTGAVVILVLGPLFRDALRIPTGYPHETVILRAIEDLHSVVATADLVMCRGGYGVINESAAGGARVLASPAPRNTDDQARRVLDFTATGRCELMREDATPTEIAQQVERVLKAAPGSPISADDAALETLFERLANLATTRAVPEALADLSDIHV